MKVQGLESIMTIDVNFKELHFLCSTNATAAHTVTFTNRFAFRVAFKIRCTAPDWYDVRPASGSIEAGEEQIVEVYFHPQKKTKKEKKNAGVAARTDKFRVFFKSDDGADFHFNMVSLVGSAADERTAAAAAESAYALDAASGEQREWTEEELAAWRDNGGTWSADSGGGDAAAAANLRSAEGRGHSRTERPTSPTVSWSDADIVAPVSTVRQRQQRVPPSPPAGLPAKRQASPSKSRRTPRSEKRRASSSSSSSATSSAAAGSRSTAVGIARLFPLFLGTVTMLCLPRLGFGAAAATGGHAPGGFLSALILLGIDPTIFVSFVLGTSADTLQFSFCLSLVLTLTYLLSLSLSHSRRAHYNVPARSSALSFFNLPARRT